ncbi:translocation/assembly module TamB domain-containing protein [Paucidesulfovibrio longus]|uniref:hypothetical protein n=1 Tax=Paucidesulfovibrio longus TaxID=889 RepID=UPI0003B3DF08|nr:hypothetical protein [Paucidesulfovibrio longus]
MTRSPLLFPRAFPARSVERLAAAFCCALAVLALLAIPARAAQAGSAASGGPTVVLRGADGSPLLTLHPVGELRFDGAALRGTLALEPTLLDSPWIRGLLAGEAEARVDGERIVFERVRLRMDKARLHAQEGAAGSGAPKDAETDILLTGNGVWIASAGELRLDRLRVELSGGLVLEGGLRWSDSGGLDADFSLDASDGSRFAALLARIFPETLKGLRLRGALRLGLGFAMGGAGRAPDDLHLTLDVKRSLGIELSGTTVSVPGLRAEADLHPGTGGQWDAAGRVDVRGTLAPGGVELRSPSMEFEAGMSGGAYHLRRLRVSSADGLALAGRRLPLGSATLSGTLSPLPQDGWSIDELRLQVPGGTFTATGAVDGNGTAHCDFRGPGLDLARLGPSLAILAGLADWTAEGRLDVSGSLDMDAENVTSDVRLRLRGLNYMSPDALHMGQGLGGDLRLRSRLSLKTLRRWVNADLRLDKGEALFGATYLNLADSPLRFTANANQIGADRFKDLKAVVDWSGFGHLRAEGDLWAHGPFTDWRYRGEAESDGLDLGALFQTFVAAPQGLTRWQGPDAGLGGRGGFSLAVNADGTTADLRGRLRLEDASLRSAEGQVDLRGAYLDLPLTYRLKGPAAPPARSALRDEQLGALRIARMRTPWSERENFAVRMALVPNRFYLLDPIRIPLFGGRIRLEDLFCDAPLSRDFELSLTAAFKDIDLSQWSREAVPLEGVLHGDLGRITATRKRVAIPGSVEGDFFGGAVHADGFFMDWPLEARRQFGASALVRGLDLERLSGALGIGRVTGLIDLDLRGLLFAFGQPARFTLSATTSENDDFEKSVSLRAVNSLSVIGTGSGIGDVGVGLFASFFEEFSYSRIGFQCILNNDRFQVRGLIREGGVEYLIKKPFLTGINVVNGNPENYISFSDMLERIQRVVKGSATSGPPSGTP